MGSHQPVRRRLRQFKRRTKSSKQASSVGLRYFLHQLMWLLQRHSFLIWLIAAAVFVGAATAAVKTILDPNASVSYRAVRTDTQLSSVPTTALEVNPTVNSLSSQASLQSPQPLARRSDTKSIHSGHSASSSASPVSAGGILLLSCAAGCLLLSKWVKPQPYRPHHKFAARHNPALPAKTSPASLVASISEPDEVRSSLPKSEQAAVTQPSFLVSNAQPPAPMSASTATEMTVTVLPDDQDHPLDWNEPSLADNLDLRQKRPLSYWL